MLRLERRTIGTRLPVSSRGGRDGLLVRGVGALVKVPACIRVEEARSEGVPTTASCPASSRATEEPSFISPAPVVPTSVAAASDGSRDPPPVPDDDAASTCTARADHVLRRRSWTRAGDGGKGEGRREVGEGFGRLGCRHGRVGGETAREGGSA